MIHRFCNSLLLISPPTYHLLTISLHCSVAGTVLQAQVVKTTMPLVYQYRLLYHVHMVVVRYLRRITGIEF
jgi:hypothetical protein